MKRNRNIQLKFYINEDEQKALDVKLKNYTGNKSEYIRDCIFKTNASDMQLFNENVTELIRQYKAIGNNFNQITRAINQGNVQVDTAELELIRKELDRLWQLLKLLKVGGV